MKKKIKLLTILVPIILLFISSVCSAQELMPTSDFFVNDFANILSSHSKTNAQYISENTYRHTTAQIVVVTVPNMNGEVIENYANDLFNKWGIGQKHKDNGILLLIAQEERKIRIEVGYGLEGALNDAKVGRILDNVAIPSLRQNNYDGAVLNVLNELQGIIYKEYNVEGGFDNYEQEKSYDSRGIIPVLFVLFIIGYILSRFDPTGISTAIFDILLAILLSFRGGSSSSGGGRVFSGGGGRSGGGGASRGF